MGDGLSFSVGKRIYDLENNPGSESLLGRRLSFSSFSVDCLQQHPEMPLIRI